MFPATVVALLNRKTYPTFKLYSSSSKLSNQLRYGVKLVSDDLEGLLLLVDSLSWMEVYFSGIPISNCSIIRDTLDEAVSSCADPLSYDPSALKFTVSLLCRHPDHMTDLNIQPHPAKLIYSKYVQCTIMRQLEPIQLDTEKEGHWFTGYKGMLFSTYISYLLF